MKSNWQTKRLGELCNIQIGKTPPRRVTQYWGEGQPWVKVSELNGQEITKTEEEITDIAVKNLYCKKVPKGSVLYSFKLSIGKLGIAGVDLYTNEAIAALIVKNKQVLDPKFLFYTLPLVQYEKFTSGAAKGKHLTLKRYPFCH